MTSLQRSALVQHGLGCKKSGGMGALGLWAHSKPGDELVGPQQPEEVVREHALQRPAECDGERAVTPLGALRERDVGREGRQRRRGRRREGGAARVVQRLHAQGGAPSAAG